jgi:hypothetical protein
VTFRDGPTVLGTGTLNASGMETLTTSSLSVGNHTITVVYQGNGNYRSSTSPKLTQRVNRTSTATGLTASPNSLVYVQSVSLSPTDTAASPGAGSPSDGSTITGRQHAPRQRQSGFHSPVVALGHLLGHHRLQKEIPIGKASTSAKLSQTVNA